MPGIAVSGFGAKTDTAVTDPTADASLIAALKGLLEAARAGKQLGIIMPAAWTAADITFAVASESGGTFVPLYDDPGDGGTEVLIDGPAVSTARAIDMLAGSLAPWRYIKIRSGTSGTPVNQGAERTLTVVCNGITHSTTIANGVSLSSEIDLGY